VADAIAIEFQAPSGETLAFEWDEARLAELDPDPAADPVWRLRGKLDWDQVTRVRVLSARLGDGRLLAIAALRPTGAEGHGEELVAGLLGRPGEFEQLDEALFSTEYDPDSLPRRVGLELYGPGAGLAIRVAADVEATARDTNGQIERLSAALAIRGEGGAGVLDMLERR